MKIYYRQTLEPTDEQTDTPMQQRTNYSVACSSLTCKATLCDNLSFLSDLVPKIDILDSYLLFLFMSL